MTQMSLRADPEAVARGAGELLDAALSLAQELRRNSVAELPTGVFGDLPGAAGLHRGHAESQADLQVTLGRFQELLDGDADRLYRVAFALQEAERAAAERMTPRAMPAPRTPGRGD